MSIQLNYFFRHPYSLDTDMMFENPIDILCTYKIEDIPLLFNQIESYLDDGYYVAGYVSYEAALGFNSSMTTHTDTKMPLLWFGVFEKPSMISTEEKSSIAHSLAWKPDVSPERYTKAIQTIHQEIENGNTYQTNYTLRLNSPFTTDALSYFHQLKEAQRADFCAYLDIGDYQILSASPELFFAWDGEHIETRPMKGTIQRGLTFDEDRRLKEKLKSSTKDQAENVMIVDLLRNDLSRIAERGSVHVSKLFDIESYPTVHQMTSTIEAKTKPETTVFDIFKALFPCGSITGAPKVKTMSLIHELESSPREIYCGTIGYMTPARKAIFNIPIRTVWIDKENRLAEYGVGGGITWDSNAKDEYDEVVAKGAVLTAKFPEFDLLESLLLEDGKLVLLDHHLARLSHSAEYFQYKLDQHELNLALFKLEKQFPVGRFKVRLIVNKQGHFSIETQPISIIAEDQSIRLGTSPISSNNVFLYHKTTFREMYKEHKDGQEDVFDILLWNEKGHITEFTNGNVVAKIHDTLVTPPVSDGLLAGTFRESLLHQGKVEEKSITIEELKSAAEIWFINSVRGWIKVHF
ncbi:aminodeoxychorismate synthase component I [Terrilactibacillus laevilacticus]|uniref:Aminodeoxychorismate synthase component I n=1 Tax=Terrilactibacillus laevilacticus TaxID=1380157 RepID=A0ABW5PNG8_9BACI|nr:aminodeoxychorismate synthase component I [Terrilactibacillus laevilacticus]